MKHALFDVIHKESRQQVSVYGAMVTEWQATFLIMTSDGWDTRPADDFIPVDGLKLELE